MEQRIGAPLGTAALALVFLRFFCFVFFSPLFFPLLLSFFFFFNCLFFLFCFSFLFVFSFSPPPLFSFFFCALMIGNVCVHAHSYQGSFYVTSYHIIEVTGGKAAI